MLPDPPIPERPQLAVSAAIFRDGKVLLVRRARSPGKGFHSLPGGRVEFGESLHEALVREVREETALTIERWNARPASHARLASTASAGELALESAPLSWSVDDLPHTAPSFMRAERKPVMAWTVRRPEQWAAARLYADQAVFEGLIPSSPAGARAPRA